MKASAHPKPTRTMVRCPKCHHWNAGPLVLDQLAHGDISIICESCGGTLAKHIAHQDRARKVTARWIQLEFDIRIGPGCAPILRQLGADAGALDALSDSDLRPAEAVK